MKIPPNEFKEALKDSSRSTYPRKSRNAYKMAKAQQQDKEQA